MRITSVRGNKTYEIDFNTHEGTSQLGTSTTITDAKIARKEGKWILLGWGHAAKHPHDQHDEFIGSKTSFRRAINALKRRGDIDKAEADFLWYLFFTMWGREEVEMFAQSLFQQVA